MRKKILTLDDYQAEASRTAIYPHRGKNLIYVVMGLNGESGELANKVKKLMRSYGLDTNTDLVQLYAKGDKKTKRLIESLYDELGGVLWYVARTATELGVMFNEIGLKNLEELSNRVKSDTVEGSGDDYRER